MLSDKELDAKFERMSRECANSMNGTRPKTKKTTNKKSVKGTTKKKK